jgi:hypothetical protein
VAAVLQQKSLLTHYPNGCLNADHIRFNDLRFNQEYTAP